MDTYEAKSKSKSKSKSVFLWHNKPNYVKKQQLVTKNLYEKLQLIALYWLTDVW